MPPGGGEPLEEKALPRQHPPGQAPQQAALHAAGDIQGGGHGHHGVGLGLDGLPLLQTALDDGEGVLI